MKGALASGHDVGEVGGIHVAVGLEASHISQTGLVLRRTAEQIVRNYVGSIGWRDSSAAGEVPFIPSRTND